MLAASDPAYEQACAAIAARLQGEMSASDMRRIIRATASEYRLCTMPANEDIIRHLVPGSRYRRLLKVKPAKTASGVAVIAVMPQPYE